MRIKLFEEYSEVLFEEISRNEGNDKFNFFNWRTGSLIPGLKAEDSGLQKFDLVEVKFFQSEFSEWIINDGLTEWPVIHITKYRGDYRGYVIIKHIDEWFYVFDKSLVRYYKCDTFEGVKNLFKYKYSFKYENKVI